MSGGRRHQERRDRPVSTRSVRAPAAGRRPALLRVAAGGSSPRCRCAAAGRAEALEGRVIERARLATLRSSSASSAGDPRSGGATALPSWRGPARRLHRELQYRRGGIIRSPACAAPDEPRARPPTRRRATCADADIATPPARARGTPTRSGPRDPPGTAAGAAEVVVVDQVKEPPAGSAWKRSKIVTCLRRADHADVEGFAASGRVRAAAVWLMVSPGRGGLRSPWTTTPVVPARGGGGRSSVSAEPPPTGPRAVVELTFGAVVIRPRVVILTPCAPTSAPSPAPPSS